MLKNTVIQERLGLTQDIIARIQQRKGVSNTLGKSFEWSTGDTPSWHQRVTCMGKEVEEDQREDGWI